MQVQSKREDAVVADRDELLILRRLWRMISKSGSWELIELARGIRANFPDFSANKTNCISR